MTDIKAIRKAQLVEAIEALGKAEKALADLVESYPTEGAISAAHPKMGFSSTRNSIVKLIKALKASRV